MMLNEGFSVIESLIVEHIYSMMEAFFLVASTRLSTSDILVRVVKRLIND